MNEPLFLIVDLFCGAGGTTTGFAQAEIDGNLLAKVIACVNHDPIAIKSHWANHPEVKHFEEDIRTLDLTELIKLVEYHKNIYPNAYVILWASLECTNFSNAKGGQPRDADSRTLADHLPRYITAIQPDYIQIENVVEFMSWGPLDNKGKPVSRKNGSDWMRWRSVMRGDAFNAPGYSYRDEWKELNSANYGAYTSRNRLFGVFSRPWLPICYPEPTHAKKPTSFSMHGDLKKWMAVKEVLDFSDEGESIFNRKKPLSPKTLERIYAGLLKYVAIGHKAFISKYFSGRPKGKVNSVNDPSPTVTTFGGNSLVNIKTFSDLSVDSPAGAITTIDHHAIVSTVPFIVQRNTGAAMSKLVGVEGPARTLTQTGGNQDLVQAQFLTSYYGSGFNTSVDQPAPTVTTKDRAALIQPKYFIDKHFGKAQNQSIEQPAGSILTNDKHRLVYIEPAPIIPTNRKHHYLVNPSWFGNPGSVDQPCPVIVARQDKAPLYLVEAEGGRVAIPVYETDPEIMVEIKQFMVAFELVDIKMRMLRVHELLKIQGFPDKYKLEGNQSDQKKFIGNSVVPLVVKKWTEALALKIIEQKTNAACA